MSTSLGPTVAIASPMAKANPSFYEQLRAFHDFSEITHQTCFVEVPSDWILILTDIKGSTQAIKEGRYKQVNLIGAATITALVNTAGTTDIPFIFGGDGATLLAPPTILSDLIVELEDLQWMAQQHFNLELRVGFISVGELIQKSQTLWVGKYELSPKNYMAQFRGTALSYAEDLLKSKDPSLQMLGHSRSRIEATNPSMAGLSCRLQPLRSTQGKILTLLCRSVEGEPKASHVIKEVLLEIKKILKNDLMSANPVRSENMLWPVIPLQVSNEAKLKKEGVHQKLPYSKQWLIAFAKALVSNFSLRFEFPFGAFRPAKYKKELPLNSDFKKYDETLRMVLDCNTEQITAIERLLEQGKMNGDLIYGLHLSDSALMTCLVKDPTRNQHIHFIDGADGGYAMAALQLKNQIKNQPTKPLKQKC